jgi:hypothetical protein
MEPWPDQVPSLRHTTVGVRSRVRSSRHDALRSATPKSANVHDLIAEVTSVATVGFQLSALSFQLEALSASMG